MALERQMAPTLLEIDFKHLARYAWASQFCIGRHVLDAACGCGYGSFLMGPVARTVRGIDRSAQAIGWAQMHFAMANVSYLQHDMNDEEFPFAGFQAIVSLETIEHLDRPVEETLEMFREALCPGGHLCISHPINEPPGRNEFHKQFWIDDYKLGERIAKLGFQRIESKRQEGCKLYDYHLLALRKA